MDLSGLEGEQSYLTDRLGTVRDIANTSGSVIDHLAYDSFGKVTNETSPTNGDRFKFTGRELDAETGFYYFRARYYDPATGRFVTQDPIGFDAGDANLYRYVGNGPTNDTDRSGLDPYVYWSWGGFAEGLGNGFAIVGNTASFGLISPLNRYANDVVAENGGLYNYSGAAATVSREALITAGTLGTAQILRGGLAAGYGARAVMAARAAQPAILAREGYQTYASGRGGCVVVGDSGVHPSLHCDRRRRLSRPP
jgi:RHS repeat-associated protein